jgi:NAD(P)-dependent dehydrogenase (short-subunit alcohol dehydrogenase family)
MTVATATDNRARFLDSLFGLEGKVALVTGGGGLIGGEFSRALASAGAKVIVLGRNRENTTQVAEGINSSCGTALAIVADTLNEADLARTRDQVQAEFGGLDILVNTVGGPAVASSRLLPEQPLFGAEFLAGTRAVIELNLLGQILPIFAFGDMLAGGPGGVIVNVSSGAARHVSSGVFGYSAAKAGVEQMTRWLAVEMGRRYEGRVRVNAISPGFTIGGKNKVRFYNEDGTPNERTLAIMKRIPLGRMGHPKDLVGLLIWLCSPSSEYVTGEVIAANGGHGLDTGV